METALATLIFKQDGDGAGKHDKMTQTEQQHTDQTCNACGEVKHDMMTQTEQQPTDQLCSACREINVEKSLSTHGGY